MASKSLTPNSPNGQTELDSLATPFAIQQNINAILRQLADNDAAFMDSLDLDRRYQLSGERLEIEAALFIERQRYTDALGADRLWAQGKAAVDEAWDIICQGMTY
jgi:hypothetical protein